MTTRIQLFELHVQFCQLTLLYSFLCLWFDHISDSASDLWLTAGSCKEIVFAYGVATTRTTAVVLAAQLSGIFWFEPLVVAFPVLCTEFISPPWISSFLPITRSKDRLVLCFVEGPWRHATIHMRSHLTLSPLAVLMALSASWRYRKAL